MTNLNKWLAILLAFFFCVDVGVFVYKKNITSIGFGIFKKIDYHTVSLVEVVSGNEFVLTLEDGRRIHGVLKVNAIPAAKDEVMKLINTTHDPKVCLLSETNDVWLIDLVVVLDTDNGPVDIHLANWLREKQLV